MIATLTTSRRRTWLRRGVIAFALLIILWLLSSFLVAQRLTARPQPRRDEPVRELPWGKIEAFRLTTDDGEEIGAWFIDGRQNRVPVLLLHGNGSCRGENLREAEIAGSAGHPVLLLSVRAHGDSSGERNDFGYSARREVVAAVDWLAQRCPGRRPVIWGRSLGSAAALFASAELGDRVKGYLLECPYSDLRTAVRNRTRQHLPPFVEFVAYAGLRTMALVVMPDFDRIAPIEAIGGISSKSRVLILAGGQDRRATVEEARALRDACPGEAELKVFEEGDHLRLAEVDLTAYRETILGFLARCEP